ncbi:BglG family transcription antiterminator [Companilactobacillus zhachilii]|uniref:BglG family transcription antiterminator n=1 Tax=Companilactobacillus zhachilii TaxID=2304606 RepID=UPI00403347C4
MNHRQAELLITLCTTDTYATAKSLAVKYHISTKTIYKDLNLVSNYIKNDNVILEKKRHVGIRIEGTDEDKKMIISRIKRVNTSELDRVSFAPETRRASIVKQIILDDHESTLKGISDKWIVSKTSILNDIELINKVIETSSGSIQSNGSKMIFVGTEEQRQIAVSTYLVSIRGDSITSDTNQLEFFFTTNVVVNIDEIFSIFKRSWLTEMPKYYLFALRVITMVQVYRLRDNVHFEYEAETFNRWRDGEVFKMANKMIEMAAQRLQFRYNSDDVERLAHNLSAYRIGTESNDLDPDWDSTIDTLMRRMESIQKMNFLGKTQLKSQLLYHVPAMILRLKQGMIVKNPLLNDIKNQYSALFGMTWYALSFLEEKYGIALNDDEVSFITIYFHIALNKIIPQNKVLIVFGQHSQLKSYVESQIEQLLPANTKLSSISINEINQTDIKDVGLVIAVDVTGMIVDTPVISISPLMDDRDQADILMAFAKHVILLHHSEKDTHFPVLKKFISSDLIFWKNCILDKDSALKFLINKLEQQGIVYKSFRESIYRRERLGSTEIEGGSALPHAAPETVKKMAIAILILQKPIWWNTENVNMVILACVPNDQVKIYRELVLDIYRLVQDKQQVHMISGFKSTKALINMIDG